MKTETGECYYLDESGRLCVAISYTDENGTVTTEVRIVNENI